jgi:transglutaminase-like putative cysteine protease
MQSHFRLALRSVLAALLFAPAAPVALRAADFPPITDAERALQSVPGEPNAPAVVLGKSAELWLMDLARQEISSRQGMSQGEVEIPHSSFVRLVKLDGRTVLPDGRVVPLPKDARFERRLSKAEKLYVTSVAFPAVEVGAILDYEYELRFDSLYFLEPWFLSDELPVRRAEIVFHVPTELGVQAWSRDPFSLGLRSESGRVTGALRDVRFWAENLPAVPDEPFGLPFPDLAVQVMLLPTEYRDGAEQFPLMKSWETTSALLFDDQYDKAWRKDSAAERKARELAGKGTPREKAAALYRFVRDEIASEDLPGVILRENATVDGVLARKSGDSADKALLLQQMLRAVGLSARPVWAAERGHGTVDPQLPNPGWFQRVLVAVELDGQRVYLDPADSTLAFGALSPEVEGTQAVLPDRKKPETVTLPVTPSDQSVRRAAVKLALDAEGVVSGTGSLELTGHHAWGRLGWLDSREEELAAWQEWLEEGFGGFAISDVKVEESVDERRVRLTWTLGQRAEEALGDEVSLSPSAPLGPAQQPFALPAASRRSPVVFDFADRDEVTLELTWPPGWQLDARPRGVRHDGAGLGLLETSLEVDETGRSLTYRRTLEVRERLAGSREQYEGARSLFATAENNDAQKLVLVRR